MTKDTPRPLFREQALQQRRRSIYGQVILKGSLSSWIITALLAVIIILCGLYLCLAQVATDGGPITLWRWLWSLK